MNELDGLTPTTELDAVNRMLFVIGESPVDTLDENTVADSGDALRLLRSESRALQTKGWSFNKDLCATLSPDSDGNIPLPINCLGIEFVGVDRNGPFAYRAGKVYDRRNQTFAISRAVTANVVQLLNYEDLPESARKFIMVRAARKMQDGALGDGALHQFHEKDELAAWVEFLDSEENSQDYNIVRDSPTVRAVTISRYRYMT